MVRKTITGWAAVAIYMAEGESAVASSSWVYSWHSSAEVDFKCACTQVEVEVVIAGFESQQKCEESLAREAGAYCVSSTSSHGGVSEADCKDAVSANQQVSNVDCEKQCLQLVVGTVAAEEFQQACAFEPVHHLGPRDVVPAAPAADRPQCFFNYVLGYADYNADATVKPLRVYEDVDSAASCQTLCQQTAGCVWFQWRGAKGNSRGDSDKCTAVSDDDPEELTCVVYDRKYVDVVLAATPSEAASAGVCDTAAYQALCNAESTNSWFPFDNHCLQCDCTPVCVWNSSAHISGPAYCPSADGSMDICNLPEPTAHTTETAECPTEECVTETCPEGAANDSVAKNAVLADEDERDVETMSLTSTAPGSAYEDFAEDDEDTTTGLDTTTELETTTGLESSRL